MTPSSTADSKFLRSAALCLAPAAALCLMACSSPKKTTRSEYGPTYKERMSVVDKIIKDKNYTVTSSFDKDIPKSTTEKAYKASTFNARNAAGLKQFSGTNSTYHSKEFAESGKKNPTELKLAKESQQQSKQAAQMFRAPDARFELKPSPDGGKTFTQGNGTFATRENRAGTQAIEKNKKPVILEPEKPVYSEDDVKRLLNKS